MLSFEKSLIFSLLLLTLIGSEAGAQKPDSSGTKQATIGVSVPLSGDAASYGEDIKNTVEFAAAALGDGKYRLVFEDDQCSEKGAVTAAQKLITIDKVQAVVGFGCSGAVLGAAPVYERAKVIVIASATGAPAISQAGDYIFRTIPSLNIAAERLFEHASHHYRAIGILSEETAYCQGLKEAFAAMNGSRAVTLHTEDFLPNTSDFRTQLAKLRSAGVDAMFINPQTEAGLVTIVKQLKSMGWNVPLYAAYYPGSPAYLRAFGAGGDGIIYADLPFPQQMLNAVGLAGFKHYKAKYGEPKSGDFNVTLTYLAFLALHQALEHQPSDIRGYLYRNTFSGWVDRFTFDANGDVVSDKITFVLKTIRNGKPSPL